MKVALITDTHWGVRNDSITFLDYFTKFYSEVFFPYLDKHGIDTVVHLGDIVDRRKFINYVTLNRFKDQWVFELEKRGIDFHVIVGNHDVPYRNTNEINAMKELFSTIDASEKMSYYYEPKTVNFDGCDILLMPWINNANYKDSIQAMNDSSAQVCFGHFEIEGFEMMRGVKNDHGLKTDIFSQFDTVYSGHFHHKSTRGNITYLGSPYEMTWSDYNDPRGFHIFDTDTRELEFIQNPYRMFHKVVYNDEGKAVEEYKKMDFEMYRDTYVKVIVQNKTNPYAFDLFLDNLYKSDPINVSIVDDNKHLDKQPDEEIFSEAEDTMTILSKYVSNMEFQGDSAKLNVLLRDLYQEAVHLEL